MSKLIITIVLTLCTTTVALEANLALLQYDPLLFQLTFSAPVSPPNFQLLYNNIHNIPYTFLTNHTLSNRFMLQANAENITPTSGLQMYDLMFNNPLAVGDGNLSLSSFTLHAQKIGVELNFPTALGILILIGAYFFNAFTEIGKMLIEFIHVYILYMFLSSMVTTLYRELYIGLLIIPPVDILLQETYDIQNYILACLILPLAIFLLFAAVGFSVKKWEPKERTILGTIIYEELVFDSFIKLSNIFAFNLIFNSIQFLVILASGDLPILQDIRGVGGVLVYFNLITFVAIFYLKVRVLNPRVGQTEGSWDRYIKSQQFKDFRQLHQKLHLKPWYKRNFFVILAMKNCLISVLFFWPVMFPYLLLLIEFLHIFMIFTIRPFTEEFYLNTKVVCRLIFLVEYIFIVLGNLYFSMGQITFNYSSASNFILTRDSIFIVLIFGIFIAIFFQIYFKCSNLNYDIKVVREAHQFHLEFIQKNKNQTQTTSKRHHTTVYSEKSKQSSSRHYKHRDQSQSSPRHKKKKKGSQLKVQLLGELEGKDKNKGAFQLQMVELTGKGEKDALADPLGKQDKEQSRPTEYLPVHKQRSQKATTSGKTDKQRKWKKESVLEEMLHKKD